MSRGEASGASRRWLAALSSGVVLALLVAYLWSHRAWIVESYALDPFAFSLVGALGVLGMALRAFANRLHFAGLGVALSSLAWFRLVSVTAFANYLPLSAGLLAKALFLNRVHDVPVRRFAVGQATFLLLVLATNGAVGLGTLFVRFPEAVFGVLGAGFAAMVLSGVLLLVPEPMRRKLSTEWFPFAENVGTAARGGWSGVIVIQVLMLLVSSASLLLCFGMGASEVGFIPCLLFTSAAVVTRFVTIVPGALGVREFLIGGLAALTGFELRDAVVAATLARAAEVVVVFALGGLFTWSLSREVALRLEETTPEDAGS